MKAQDYINFKPFEKELDSARSHSYVRFPHNQFLVFSEAVKQWRGNGVTPNEKTCMHCLLRLVKAVADEYFKYKSSPAGKKIDKDANDQES